MHLRNTVVWAAACAPGALPALDELAQHIDVIPTYSGGAWTWTIGTNTVDRNPEEVYFPALDVASPGGDRYVRPAGSQWNFTGAAAGENLWFFPQSDNGRTWPGMENIQSGVFASYVESDPRAGSAAERWIRVSLASLDGPGIFSMYQIQGGSPLVWMTSQDGIDAHDVFYLSSPGHDHMWWSFSEKGVYRIGLTARAYLGPGATNETVPSPEVPLIFTVGARGSWRAANFGIDEVMDELVAGPDADPDADGWANLLEYGFGTDPNSGDPVNGMVGESARPEIVQAESGGQIYGAVRYLRRTHADADLDYSVEWSGDLGFSAPSDGVTAATENLPGDWQRVTVRDTVPVGTSPRFSRIRVQALD